MFSNFIDTWLYVFSVYINKYYKKLSIIFIKQNKYLTIKQKLFQLQYN